MIYFSDEPLYEISDKAGEAFIDGLIPSLVCILIVFAILIAIYLIVTLVNKFKALDVKKQEVKETETKTNTQSFERTKLEDIEDDDMMAAVLVATIDYRNEIKEDVRLIRVRKIG